MKYATMTLSIIVLFAANVHSQSLAEDFDTLLGALKEGKAVQAVLHYGKFRLVVDGKEAKAPDTIGGMEVKTFEYFAPGSVGNPRGYLTTSETVLISHPTRGYVYNYVKLNVYEDHAVDVVARYLNPTTFEIVMDEVLYGQMSNRRDNLGAFFYVQESKSDRTK
jgi:hypothetical protein